LSDQQPERPKKNWVLQIFLCGAIAAWQVYELTAPGEAQSGTLIALQVLLLACALVGCFGALAMHFSKC
jgi:hypothetical protein